MSAQFLGIWMDLTSYLLTKSLLRIFKKQFGLDEFKA